MTWPQELERYESGRSTPHKESVCNAPFSSMYFAATGKVAPCWILLGHLGEYWSTERSIADIWNGEPFTELRRALTAREFPGACGRCRDDIASGAQPLAAVYDNDEPIGPWPNALELELSNLCNYACLMCTGVLSSKIRRDREHLPPIDVPYDDSFVEQVEELLPHLRRIRFSGGEPMLHPIVHKITDRIIEIRPDLRIDVSTNGSILNKKVRGLIERAEVLINVSFDSFRPEVYETIRVDSNFEKLMANLESYQEHFRTHPGILTINTNPMRANWQEMPDFVRWCDERDLFLTFNTVLHPADMSLRTLPAAELRAIHQTLAEADLAAPTSSAMHKNRAEFANVVVQVGRWADEAEESGGQIADQTPVSLPTTSAPQLSESELATRASEAATAGAPVVIIDVGSDMTVTSVSPSYEAARAVGIEASAGAHCETPLDVLSPSLAHPDLTMEVSGIDADTRSVTVTTPDGLDLAIWTRTQYVDSRFSGVRAFIAARAVPTPEHLGAS